MTDAETWPMPVVQFLAGDYLQRSDIVLCRGKRSLFSRLIRWATRSYFSHAGLIFLVPNPREGFNHHFLLEAIPSGVCVTNLRHYLVRHAADYDIAIKRVERPWMTQDAQRLVRGHMLDFVRSEYDYHTIWRFALSAARQVLFGARSVVTGFRRAVKHQQDRGRLVPASFVCSGFVQYGYYAAILALIAKGQAQEDALGDVLFNPALTGSSSTDDIVATTPEDLAASDKAAWKYVILNGMAYDVRGSADVAQLLGSKAAW